MQCKWGLNVYCVSIFAHIPQTVSGLCITGLRGGNISPPTTSHHPTYGGVNVEGGAIQVGVVQGGVNMVGGAPRRLCLEVL